MTTTTTTKGVPTAEAYGLTPRQLDELAAELDAVRDRVLADLGQDDVDYLRRLIRTQRALEVSGRGLLFLSWLPPFWLAGTAALAVSKILDNMEIGHNVMHGQYDWANDPALTAQAFEWDTNCPGDQWRHSHNYLHHTFTNVIGKDRDVGYGVLRMSEEQPWSWPFLLNPLYATFLALLFQDGVMLHDVEVDRIQRGERSWAEAWPVLRDGLRKTGRQSLKDYVIWPALTGPSFLPTLAANATANVLRNVWAFSIIFCGHFPAGTHEFTEAECEGESRGHWYLRQLLGSANIDGGPLFHIMSGNLSHQIEHHLYPDLPARRYKEVAPEVREIAQRHGLPYVTGGFARQLGSVAAKIVRLALPGRRPAQPDDAPVSEPAPLPAAA